MSGVKVYEWFWHRCRVRFQRWVETDPVQRRRSELEAWLRSLADGDPIDDPGREEGLDPVPDGFAESQQLFSRWFPDLWD